MVLRFAVSMIVKKVARIVRINFLVRGCTKNDCDRLFNPLKSEHRKVNTHVPQDLKLTLNILGSVNAIQCEPEMFLDWDSFTRDIPNQAAPAQEPGQGFVHVSLHVWHFRVIHVCNVYGIYTHYTYRDRPIRMCNYTYTYRSRRAKRVTAHYTYHTRRAERVNTRVHV